MYAEPYELRRTPQGMVARVNVRGSAVLASPTINRGTAFTDEQRQMLGLTGLLPTGVSTIDGQVARTYGQFSAQKSALAKWVCMANLRDRNDVLFYRLLSEHIAEMLPIVYTPTVGWLSNGSATSSAAPTAASTCPSTIPTTSKPPCATPAWDPRTSTYLSPPTPRASWASATRAWAASRSPSASWPSTPDA